MSKHAFIGCCDRCGTGLFPEDFNLGGARRLSDGQMFCEACAGAGPDGPPPRRPARPGDTGVFSLPRPATGEPSKRVDIGCMGCGCAFPVALDGRTRYVFCPECARKMRVELR